ncbi:MAG: PAS domain S-box protein [Candidatus Sungbacteria bacterium]|uniref:PAS domain S-box protein n=1 Tax=Candidatus Sungiibacteriota bacterium TaxID=2750080 RepID=A0A9D6QTH5_9BACT|nr:PAS domain S-box protein [Candidatus Sungbacteria bacterium]
MRFRTSLTLSVLVTLLVVGLVIASSRAISPILISAERQNLISLFPIVQNVILETNSFPKERMQKIRDITGVDVTLLDESNHIQQTTLDSLRLGTVLYIASGEDTIFDVVAINGVSSFILTAPLKLNGVPLRLVISKKDDLLGPFLDEFLTASVFVVLLGLAGSIAVGVYIASRERSASFALERSYAERMETEVRRTRSSTEAEIGRRIKAGENEKRAFRSALGASDEGIFVIDALGKIIFFNPKMEILSGYEEEGVLNHALSGIIWLTRKGKVDQLTGLIPRVLATGVPEVFPRDTLLKRKDGNYVPVSVKTVPVRDDTRSGITHIVVTVAALPTEPRVVPEEGAREEITLSLPKPLLMPSIETREMVDLRKQQAVPVYAAPAPAMSLLESKPAVHPVSEYEAGALETKTAGETKLEDTSLLTDLEELGQIVKETILPRLVKKEPEAPPAAPPRGASLAAGGPSSATGLAAGGPPANLPV